MATLQIVVNIVGKLETEQNSCGIARLPCDSTAFLHLNSIRQNAALIGLIFGTSADLLLASASLHNTAEQHQQHLYSAKLHYTDTGYGHVAQHHQRTSSQQFYNLLYNKFATSQCQSPTSRHVKMLRCGKFLSAGGEFVGGVVQRVRSRCPCSGVWHIQNILETLGIVSCT